MRLVVVAGSLGFDEDFAVALRMVEVGGGGEDVLPVAKAAGSAPGARAREDKVAIRVISDQKRLQP